MEHDMRVCSFDNVETAVFVAFPNLTENCTILQVCRLHSWLCVWSKDKCNYITKKLLNSVDWKRRFAAHFAVPIWYIRKNIFYVGSATYGQYLAPKAMWNSLPTHISSRNDNGEIFQRNPSTLIKLNSAKSCSDRTHSLHIWNMCWYKIPIVNNVVFLSEWEVDDDHTILQGGAEELPLNREELLLMAVGSILKSLANKNSILESY